MDRFIVDLFLMCVDGNFETPGIASLTPTVLATRETQPPWQKAKPVNLSVRASNVIPLAVLAGRSKGANRPVLCVTRGDAGAAWSLHGIFRAGEWGLGDGREVQSSKFKAQNKLQVPSSKPPVACPGTSAVQLGALTFGFLFEL